MLVVLGGGGGRGACARSGCANVCAALAVFFFFCFFPSSPLPLPHVCGRAVRIDVSNLLGLPQPSLA